MGTPAISNRPWPSVSEPEVASPSIRTNARGRGSPVAEFFTIPCTVALGPIFGCGGGGCGTSGSCWTWTGASAGGSCRAAANTGTPATSAAIRSTATLLHQRRTARLRGVARGPNCPSASPWIVRGSTSYCDGSRRGRESPKRRKSKPACREGARRNEAEDFACAVPVQRKAKKMMSPRRWRLRCGAGRTGIDLARTSILIVVLPKVAIGHLCAEHVPLPASNLRSNCETFCFVHPFFFACFIGTAIHTWHRRLSRRSKRIHGAGRGRGSEHISQSRFAPARIPIQRIRLQPDRATGDRRH